MRGSVRRITGGEPAGRRWLAAAVIVAGALVFPSAAAAADTVINFDDQAAGTAIENQYSAEGVTFNETPSGLKVPAPTIVTPSGSEAHSPPNVLDVSQKCGSELHEVLLWGRFAAPRNHVTLYIGNLNLGLGFPANVSLEGFDLAGNPLPGAKDTVEISSGFGLTMKMGIQSSSSEISFFRLASDAECPVGIDDLSFDEVPGTIPPDFAISAEGLGPTLVPGASANVTLRLHRNSTSFGPISFGVSGLPSEVSGSVSPSSTNGPEGTPLTLTLSAGPGAPAVTAAPVTVTGTPSPTSGSKNRSVTIPVSVSGNFDMRAQGLEVTQGIQDPVAVLVPSGSSGGGYSGLDLVKHKRTAVRFYADAAGAPAGGATGIGATLSGFRNGAQLPGSPLHPDYGPAALTDTGEWSPAPVFGPELISDAHAFTFTLPASWTVGTIKLVGSLTAPPPSFGPASIQCSGVACKANDTFTENDVTFNPTEKVTLTTVAMTENGHSPIPASAALADGKLVAPLADDGFVVLPYQASIDITDIVNSKDEHLNKTNAAKGRVDQWASDNGHPNYATMGVSPTGTGGTTSGGTALVTYTPDGTGDDRPFTSVSHELFHLFGLKHASQECGGGQDNDSDDGDQTGVPWPLKPGDNEDTVEANVEGGQKTDTDTEPPEGFGQLLGVGLDMGTSPYTVLADGLNGVSEYYDFMSYCSPTRGSGDAGNWLSPINWENVFNRFAPASGSSVGGAHGSSVGAGGAPRRTGTARAARRGHGGGHKAVAAIHRGRLRVIAYAGTEGVQIGSVGFQVGPPLPRGGSAYALRALGGDGKPIATVPMEEGVGHIDEVGPLDELTGEVPARRVDRVEVLLNGTVVASRNRPRRAPKAVVLAPRRGARVGGGGKVKVRWRATDRSHSALTASIDYSRDGGRSWHTVFVGPSRGHASMSSFYFAASEAARVRVRVNDGFNETAAVSPVFFAVGAKPQVAIEKTLTSVAGDARLQLSGQAFDAGMRELRGDSLRWFDGPFAIGRGAEVSAGPLPAGKDMIRLVATDSAGRTGTAQVRVTVRPVRLPFLKLGIPKQVPRAARKLVFSARSAVPATLTIGKTRFKLGPKKRRYSLPIRRGTPLMLRLTATAAGEQTPFAVLISRS